MNNKLNAYLNKKINTSGELQISGLMRVFIIEIIITLVTIVEIEISRRVLNYLLTKELPFLLFCIGLFVCAQIILSFFCHWNEYTRAIVRGEIQASLFESILKKNGNLLPVNSEDFSINDKITMANGDCEKYIDGVLGRVELFVSLFTIPFYILYGLSLNIWITLLILLISVSLSYLNKKNKQKMYDCNEEINEKYGIWCNFLWKALDNLEVIRVFLAREKLLKEHRMRNDRLCETENKSLKVYLDVCLIEDSSDMIFTLLILVFSFWAVMRGEMELASIFAMMQAMNSIQKTIFRIPEQNIRLHELDSIASRINKYMGLREDLAKETVEEEMYSLVVENVSFCYGENEILQGVNFAFEKGKFYIIAGESGCGKSTLLRLIAKLLPPNQGEIKWNNKNLSDIHRDSLYEEISFISQNQVFLEDTIKKNVCMNEINEEAYLKAIAKTEINKVIEKNQFDDEKIIWTDGAPLSSGEQQMLSFANAIYHQKSLILLDEAFSAIDPAKEKHFFECLREITQKGSTVILVSHRLTNFDMSDIVLFMQNGKVIESGPFDTICQEGTIFGNWYREHRERNV